MSAAAVAPMPMREPQPVTMADLATCDRHALTNPLYVSRDLAADGFVWSWQATSHSRIREWVRLVAEDESVALAIHGDATNLDTPLLDWRACDGHTQLLAWTVRHEPLIELLSTLLQRDFSPVAIEDRVLDPASDSLQVGFAVFRVDGSPVATGCLHLSPATIDRCVARTDARSTRSGATFKHVHAYLPIIIDRVIALRRELAALTRGCIVRLDNRTLRTARPRIAIHAGRTRLIADIDGLHARVVAFATPDDGNHFPTGAAMNEHIEVAPPKTVSVDVDSLPVRLTFNAGRLMVPFGALADVKSGYVFELERRLNDQTIVIQANDVSIAVGELVVLGDFLGVRITRMLPKA